MSKQLPPPVLLRKLLSYEPATGKLYWKPRTPDFFEGGVRNPEIRCKRWNARYAGKEALYSEDKYGYLTGRVMGRNAFAHRVAWAIFYGKWPQEKVDHINGNRSDNRIENLRAVNAMQNTWNSHAKSSNKSGYKGVSWNKREKKWRAHIMKNGVMHRLGAFDCPKEAHKAYCRAAKALHGEFANYKLLPSHSP